MIPAVIARNSPPCISSAHFMTIIFLPIPCLISFVINSCSCFFADFFFLVLIPWGPGWESMRRFTCCRVAVYITCLTCHALLETKTPVLDQLSTHTRETQSALSFSLSLFLTRSHIPLCEPENVRMVRKVNRKLLNCLQDTEWQEIIEEPQTRTLTHTHSRTHLFLPLWRRHSDIHSLGTYMP